MLTLNHGDRLESGANALEVDCGAGYGIHLILEHFGANGRPSADGRWRDRREIPA